MRQRRALRSMATAPDSRRAARHRERSREFAPPELVDVEAEEALDDEEELGNEPRALRLVAPLEGFNEPGT